METPALPPVGCTQRRVAVLTTVHGDDGDDADDRGTRRAVLAMPCSLGGAVGMGIPAEKSTGGSALACCGGPCGPPRASDPGQCLCTELQGFFRENPAFDGCGLPSIPWGALFSVSVHLPRVFLLTVLAFLPILQRSRGARPPAPAPAPGPGPGPSVAWILAGIRGDGGGADVFCPQAS